MFSIDDLCVTMFIEKLICFTFLLIVLRLLLVDFESVNETLDFFGFM